MTFDQRQQMLMLRETLKSELGESYYASLPEATADQLARGAELFPKLCAPCHGGRGDGAGHNAEAIIGKPTNFTDPAQAKFFSERARLYIIEYGAPGTAMVGWGKVLPKSDIVSLYLYVRSLIKQE